MNNLILHGLLLVIALGPLRITPPVALAQSTYSTTITSNVPATLGCVWGAYVCDVQCSACTQATCTSADSYYTVGACAVYEGEITDWTATASPANHTLLTESGWHQVIWSGNTYQGAQTVDYEFTLPEDDSTPVPDPTSNPDWSFPTEPLLPYQVPTAPPETTIVAPINAGILWEVARIALTAYHVVSGGDAGLWLAFAAILMLPLGGVIVYRLLTKPPEI